MSSRQFAAIRRRRQVSHRLRLLKCLNRLAKPPLFMQQNSLHVQRLCVIRVPCQRPPEPTQCPRFVAPLGTVLAPRNLRLHPLRVQRKRLPQARFGSFHPVAVALRQRHGSPIPQSSQAAIPLPSATQPPHRDPCLRRATARPVHPCRRKVGPQHQRPPVSPFCFLDSAHPDQHKSRRELPLRQPWPAPQSLLIARESCLIFSLHRQRVAHPHVRWNQRRLTAERPVQTPAWHRPSFRPQASTHPAPAAPEHARHPASAPSCTRAPLVRSARMPSALAPAPHALSPFPVPHPPPLGPSVQPLRSAHSPARRHKWPPATPHVVDSLRAPADRPLQSRAGSSCCPAPADPSTHAARGLSSIRPVSQHLCRASPLNLPLVYVRFNPFEGTSTLRTAFHSHFKSMRKSGIPRSSRTP
jgi:hypothetical protein